MGPNPLVMAARSPLGASQFMHWTTREESYAIQRPGAWLEVAEDVEDLSRKSSSPLGHEHVGAFSELSIGKEVCYQHGQGLGNPLGSGSAG